MSVAELTVGCQGEVTLSPATLSFRDNIRGSWFVGINQPANINRKSASKLGFHQKVSSTLTSRLTLTSSPTLQPDLQ